MPLPQLDDKLELRKQLRLETKCHVCGEPCRYIHADAVWCKRCLDDMQYPHIAHLTQAERDELRQKAIEKDATVSIVNASNLGRIGF